jgi:hypothetical protein
MKRIAAAFVGCLLVCGCSHHDGATFQTLTMDWQPDIPDAGLTNHCLIIRTFTSASSGTEQTNVDSLDEAANILGKYGWQLVSTENKGDIKSYHMSRLAREDGKTFTLEIYNSAWNKP